MSRCTSRKLADYVGDRFAHAGQGAGPCLLVFEPHAARDLDSLCLRRAGTVQAFGQVADRVAADRHVLDQPQDAHAVDGLDAALALQELADQRDRSRCSASPSRTAW